jgi:hypothetical protein
MNLRTFENRRQSFKKVIVNRYLDKHRGVADGNKRAKWPKADKGMKGGNKIDFRI